MNESNQVYSSTAQEQGLIWGERPEDWANHMEDKKLPIYKAVLEKISPVAGKHVLDVGCGAGTFCGLMSKENARVQGLDASFSLIHLARQRVPKADFRVGQIEHLPFQDGTFDIITGFNSFQYAFDPLAAIKEACRVAQSGATIVMAIWGDPNDCDGLAYIKSVVSLLPSPPVKGPGPFALSTDGKLWSFVKQAGLQPLEQIDVHIPWTYPDEDTALRSLLSSGPAIKAVLTAGEERVREALMNMLQDFKLTSGGYHLDNTLRFVVTKVS
jgi:SAM-dependent methyltransferase